MGGAIGRCAITKLSSHHPPPPPPPHSHPSPPPSCPPIPPLTPLPPPPPPPPPSSALRQCDQHWNLYHCKRILPSPIRGIVIIIIITATATIIISIMLVWKACEMQLRKRRLCIPSGWHRLMRHAMFWRWTCEGGGGWWWCIIYYDEVCVCVSRKMITFLVRLSACDVLSSIIYATDI